MDSGGMATHHLKPLQSTLRSLLPPSAFRLRCSMLRVCPVINLPNLIDDAKCFQTVRDLRWPDGVTCPHCSSQRVVKDGKDDTQPQRQRYTCSACSRRFDDLTGTIFAGHHQPLPTWILCLYLMGLNLSSDQIAKALGLDRNEVQAMTTKLPQGV